MMKSADRKRSADFFEKMHKQKPHMIDKFYLRIFLQTLTNPVIWGMIYCDKT